MTNKKKNPENASSLTFYIDFHFKGLWQYMPSALKTCVLDGLVLAAHLNEGHANLTL